MVLFISIPISIVIELIEGSSLDLHFLDEVLLDGLILPVSTWFVLTFVASRVARQIEHEDALERRQQFTRRLAEHRDYRDLTEFLVRYPATLLPASSVTLFITNSERQLELVTDWRATGIASTAAQHTCRLLLMSGDSQIGMLQIHCLEPDPIAQKAIDLLVELLPEIGRALRQAIEAEHEAERVYRAAQAHERRRLTQELHDSLAQKVFYLHLSLDQLAGDPNAINAPTRQKVEQMREVAADIYEQIRNNLSILRAWEQVNLTEAISELVRITAHNASLQVEVDVRGVPNWLSPHTCEQLYSVVREALNNVVKHAQAGHVGVTLDWQTDQLQITVNDDGVGFLLDAARPEGHYGLELMREGVESLDGTLRIASAPGQGTHLYVTVPLRPSDHRHAANDQPRRAGVLALQPSQ